jgi:cytochrome c-type biogenesis protein CcmF
VLGDASVHSFTDLGLSGQLLIYLFFFLSIAIVFMIARWREIPTTAKEVSTWSREFWIFIGVTVLCLMGFQVLIPTSIPVWNRLVEVFGGSSNMAPPAEQVSYYSNMQLWGALAVGLLSAIGQFFWWKKIDRKVLFNELFVPLVASLLVAVIIVNAAKTYNIRYALLLFAGLFTLFSNLKILYSILRSNPALSGGAVAHIGIGLMLIGIMFSSGYSKTVSLNNTGRLISKKLSEEFNRENLLLFVNETRTMAGYDIEFLGERVEPRHKSGYVDKNDIETTADKLKVSAKRDIFYKGNKLFSKGEVFEIFDENTYYEIAFSKNGKHKFTLMPRLQVNEQMGTVASPDISHAAALDLYTHVSAPMTEEGKEDWSEREEMKVKRNAEFFVNDYVAVVEKLTRLNQIGGEEIDTTFVAIQAAIKVQAERKDYYLEPVLILGTNSRGGIIADEIGDVGLKISLLNVHPETDELTLGVQSRQKNWVVIKAMEKPFVNVLWLGTLVLMAGFGIALTRRFREFNKMKAKGLE